MLEYGASKERYQKDWKLKVAERPETIERGQEDIKKLGRFKLF
jgi:hypothetical protein